MFLMHSLFNRIILLAAFSILLMPAAEAQSFSWAQAIADTSIYNNGAASYISSGATDAAGNIYSVGGFSGKTNFDRGLSAFDLTSVSDQDMFIMKEDASGNPIWVKQVKGILSGGGRCYGRAISVNPNGTVFVTGYFSDSFDFDPGPAVHKLDAINSGGDDIFILKLDSSGNFVWAGSIGTSSRVYPADFHLIAAKQDKRGDLYFTASVHAGFIGATTDVDPGPDTTILPFVGGLLIEKLDSNGNLIWAKGIPASSSFIDPTSLTLDSASNVFIVGAFSGSHDFDPGPALGLLQATDVSIFVVQYDSAGNFSWGNIIGGQSKAQANGSAMDRFGNLLITGGFSGTVDFDPGPTQHPLTAISAKDIFTLRLRNNGDFSWVKTIAGRSSAYYYGYSITTDNAGNVYSAIVAEEDSCDLDPSASWYYVGSGVAVQELDSNGNFVWGAGWQSRLPNWIGFDNKDSLYVSGKFWGANNDFDPGPGTYLLSSDRGGSGYIIKLKQTPVPTTGIEQTGQPTAISVYPNPSSGIVTISSPAVIDRIKVTNITGKVVYINEPHQSKMVIDLGDKASGLYFYEVDCGAGMQRGKLVID